MAGPSSTGSNANAPSQQQQPGAEDGTAGCGFEVYSDKPSTAVLAAAVAAARRRRVGGSSSPRAKARSPTPALSDADVKENIPVGPLLVPSPPGTSASASAAAAAATGVLPPALKRRRSASLGSTVSSTSSKGKGKGRATAAAAAPPSPSAAGVPSSEDAVEDVLLACWVADDDEAEADDDASLSPSPAKRAALDRDGTPATELVPAPSAATTITTTTAAASPAGPRTKDVRALRASSPRTGERSSPRRRPAGAAGVRAS